MKFAMVALFALKNSSCKEFKLMFSLVLLARGFSRLLPETLFFVALGAFLMECWSKRNSVLVVCFVVAVGCL